MKFATDDNVDLVHKGYKRLMCGILTQAYKDFHRSSDPGTQIEALFWLASQDAALYVEGVGMEHHPLKPCVDGTIGSRTFEKKRNRRKRRVSEHNKEVKKMTKTASEIYRENIEHLTDPLKIRAHVENLPDGELITLLKLIPTYFETIKARPLTIKRNIEAKEWIQKLEGGGSTDFVQLRTWLRKTIQTFPDDSLIFLAIGDPLPPRDQA